MSRVFSRQCAGSASQFLRLATNVHVRIWRIRLDSVSMSPVILSQKRTCSAIQSASTTPCLREVGIDLGDDLAMLGRRDVAVVGNLAALPQATRPLRGRCERRGLVARQELERMLVGGDRHPGERLVCSATSSRLRRSASIEAKSSSALRHCSTRTGSKSCVSSCCTSSSSNCSTAAGHAEGAVARVASGAAGDLAELGGRQRPRLVAVELRVVGEGDVMDVEVEAHADGIGRDEEVDVAVLVELDLRVAGAGRERAHHHRGAAALAADQLGDGVDLRRRERDDRRALRLARDLLRARIGQLREARPVDDLGVGQELADHRRHRRRAEQQRLAHARARGACGW